MCGHTRYWSAALGSAGEAKYLNKQTWMGHPSLKDKCVCIKHRGRNTLCRKPLYIQSHTHTRSHRHILDSIEIYIGFCTHPNQVSSAQCGGLCLRRRPTNTSGTSLKHTHTHVLHITCWGKCTCIYRRARLFTHECFHSPWLNCMGSAHLSVHTHTHTSRDTC